MKKVALYTLGCRVNQYETEAIAELFEKNGYEVVGFEDFSDVYIINTCTVTSIGDKKSRQMIRKAKRINPSAIVAAVGCYAQVSPDEIYSIEDVDVVCGTKDKSKIIELVENCAENGQRIKHVEDVMNIRKFEELEIEEYKERQRAFLKIQDGCDRFCSYCMIPYARGPVRSRNPESIINEVKKLSSNGYKEIILSGIHVASYGKDISNISLSDIIERSAEVEGIERIRIGSVDPVFFTEETIRRLKNVKKLCPHFHLSLQSGSSSTLKRMNRRYSADEYKDIVNKLREAFEGVSITTDVIVGFPGESPEEFEETYSFLKDIRLSKLHVFKYSPRKGTKAADMEDQVSPEEKELRSSRLIELDKLYEKAFINENLGKVHSVLFEEYTDGYCHGYTPCYIKVKVKSGSDISGEIKNVMLNEIDNLTAVGKLC